MVKAWCFVLKTYLFLLFSTIFSKSIPLANDNEEDGAIVYSSAHKSLSEKSPMRNFSLSNTRENLNGTKGSLLVPIAQLFELYLKSRLNSNRSSAREDDLFSGESKDNANQTLSESRTIASWISETLGFGKKKRNSIPYRSDITPNPPSLTSSITGFPIGQMMPVANVPIFRPNFLPNTESFPGPFNPTSILIPSEILENTGIDYWLNYIENPGNEEKPSSFETASTDADEVNFFRRPNDQRFHSSDYHDDEKDKDDHEEEEKGGDLDKPLRTYDNTPRCDKFTSHICVDDFEYPEQAIVDEIYKRRDVFELMYSEVKDNLPLVDGIPRHVEESFNYEHYYNGNNEPMNVRPMATSINEEASGYICPSEVLYGRPKLARNLKGNWKVIVNAAEFTQTVRMEKCLKPNEKCNHISNNRVVTRCAQVHSIHRLVVFEKGKGFYIDAFRIPTACSCHIIKQLAASSNPIHGFVSSSGPVEVIDKNTTPPQLSNTLWSILGSNSVLAENANLDYSSFLNNDVVRNQLLLLQQLKNNPQIASQVSPESVLQQLTNAPVSSPHLPSVPKQNNFKSQKQPSQYLYPGVYSEEPIPRIVKPNSPSSNHYINFHPATPGTTTFIRPGGGSAVAPVVQVIHVPVTATNPFPALNKIKPEEEIQQSLHPVYHPVFQLSAYESKKSTQNTEKTRNNLKKETKDQTLYISNSGNAALFNSKNDQVTKQTEPVNEDSAVKESEKTLNSINKRTSGSITDTKINFSYHPILEYISPHTNKNDAIDDDYASIDLSQLELYDPNQQTLLLGVNMNNVNIPLVSELLTNPKSSKWKQTNPKQNSLKNYALRNRKAMESVQKLNRPVFDRKRDGVMVKYISPLEETRQENERNEAMVHSNLHNNFEDDDSNHFPHQYNVEIRSRGEKSDENEQSKFLDKGFEKSKYRVVEHKEEEHWHEKGWHREGEKQKFGEVNETEPKMKNESEALKSNKPLPKHVSPLGENASQTEIDEHFRVPSLGFRVDQRFIEWAKNNIHFDKNDKRFTV
ncbi:Coagulin domain containing protein-like protein [Dinothrombium tinctorium]|uniref:Coagulin domain containing protein-like protein n=1 Tax=Dinothrombium tinctorium TaxID=1965070 RepID=A0A443R8Y9_9ACAR|nr:Coagulin domain containing protein-like protein [Dinothrombium tinctorium]